MSYAKLKKAELINKLSEKDAEIKALVAQLESKVQQPTVDTAKPKVTDVVIHKSGKDDKGEFALFTAHGVKLYAYRGKGNDLPFVKYKGGRKDYNRERARQFAAKVLNQL